LGNPGQRILVFELLNHNGAFKTEITEDLLISLINIAKYCQNIID
jgi:hypothetical protein